MELITSLKDFFNSNTHFSLIVLFFKLTTFCSGEQCHTHSSYSYSLLNSLLTCHSAGWCNSDFVFKTSWLHLLIATPSTICLDRQSDINQCIFFICQNSSWIKLYNICGGAAKWGRYAFGGRRLHVVLYIFGTFFKNQIR